MSASTIYQRRNQWPRQDVDMATPDDSGQMKAANRDILLLLYLYVSGVSLYRLAAAYTMKQFRIKYRCRVIATMNCLIVGPILRERLQDVDMRRLTR